MELLDKSGESADTKTLTEPIQTWEERETEQEVMYSLGRFKFSLRERLQLTHRPSEMNIYQNPRNELVLKSRLKVSYSTPGSPVKPYFATELRNTLNAVRFISPDFISVQGDNVEYNDVYISRLRFQPGLEWKLSKRNSVDFFLLLQVTGTGDELQGIKRGIMEMADGIAINKCDGTNVDKARVARTQFKNALALFPTPESGWHHQCRNLPEHPDR